MTGCTRSADPRTHLAPRGTASAAWFACASTADERTPGMAGPMEGFRIVELGVWVAGPATGGILADWGADVGKIEPPEGGPARQFLSMLGGGGPFNPPFELDNRSKRSIVVDLATTDGY